MDSKQFASNDRIHRVRKDFDKHTLLEEDCFEDPFILFEHWLRDALEKDAHYANAMTLCTVDEQGMPDCRTVLLRNISYSGFTFFTNYQSAKGRQIAQQPNACLLFFWKEMQRQVKVQGLVKFLPASECDQYFATRPFESQVGAWASQQSQVVASRQVIDDAYDKKFLEYQGKVVPRPAHWGGYVLLPSVFEFWQGRAGRLHDRIRYTHGPNRSWKLERLMP